ncbi:SMP-30/gluconolactonase/LRE family protein [Acidisoma cladoniae]|jgi:gluconolactonase|uniref:SMP-30/gluconolactonase/LRE family protein n=1 Tax=Acidisoma cladoniae TaxID=3040935 RepID=UPI00254A2DEA|nr:SMP-30/gluconolactonase/LRE family protein [Acidisoma sp. PAMC 29798]
MKTFLLSLLFATSLASFAQADGIKILNSDVHYPEGPVWYNGKLYYIEYDRNTVDTWDGKKNAIFASQKGCGQSAVVNTANGEFVTTCYDNGTIGRMAADGKQLPAYTQDKAGNKFVGPNDLAPDTKGGIYFTASGDQGPVIDGKVFYIAKDGTITQEAVDLHNANGLAVSKDGKILYVVETEDNRLLQFKIAPDASLSDRRVFLNLDDMTNHVTHIWPDGVKIDSKGAIYIGQSPRDVHAPLVGIIFIVDATGKLLRELKLPSPQVPNLAFSPDEKTVYVTALDQIDKSPYMGKIYSIPNN